MTASQKAALEKRTKQELVDLFYTVNKDLGTVIRSLGSNLLQQTGFTEVDIIGLQAYVELIREYRLRNFGSAKPSRETDHYSEGRRGTK